MTSPIVSFNSGTAELTTHSGRVYQLAAPPEVREPQRSLLIANAVRSALGQSVDISDALWQLVVEEG